ncbi:hypothetical protein PALI_a3398 [Pseudoalteromonas aliena SW19]|uniref:Uncharacterized protein n=1 Tax=Pseudoalteromonas aliena SW19 TaxID=1314866 RepID=A0ABR9DTU8_9GAMM|nr:hypothetical protein [Pseudoalteromonas aliena SW19]
MSQFRLVIVLFSSRYNRSPFDAIGIIMRAKVDHNYNFMIL